MADSEHEVTGMGAVVILVLALIIVIGLWAMSKDNNPIVICAKQLNMTEFCREAVKCKPCKLKL